MLKQRLWEHDHQHQCVKCYYAHNNWETWSEFIEAFKSLDPDHNNLIVRWDWKLPLLKLYILQQNKGQIVSHHIPTDSTQESEVKEFLREHWKKLKDTWKPISRI